MPRRRRSTNTSTSSSTDSRPPLKRKRLSGGGVTAQRAPGSKGSSSSIALPPLPVRQPSYPPPPHLLPRGEPTPTGSVAKSMSMTNAKKIATNAQEVCPVQSGIEVSLGLSTLLQQSTHKACASQADDASAMLSTQQDVKTTGTTAEATSMQSRQEYLRQQAERRQATWKKPAAHTPTVTTATRMATDVQNLSSAAQPAPGVVPPPQWADKGGGKHEGKMLPSTVGGAAPLACPGHVAGKGKIATAKSGWQPKTETAKDANKGKAAKADAKGQNQHQRSDSTHFYTRQTRTRSESIARARLASLWKAAPVLVAVPKGLMTYKGYSGSHHSSSSGQP